MSELLKWAPSLSVVEDGLLTRYRDELLKFNRRLNLISRNTESDIDEIHLLDSVLAVQLLPDLTSGSEIADIGSGNGLPGVVLAILKPNVLVRAVDSDSRKCEFIKHVASTLRISNLMVENARAEALSGLKIGLNRGFASLLNACSSCDRSFEVGAHFFHMKGLGWSQEISALEAELGDRWRSEVIGEYSLPTNQAARSVICTTKIA